MLVKGADDFTLTKPLTEGEGDKTRPPGEGGDGDAGVDGPGDRGLEPVAESVEEPVRVSTEAQTEGPAIGAGAGASPWWLQAPPPWALPYPMAAGRELAGSPWYPQDPSSSTRGPPCGEGGVQVSGHSGTAETTMTGAMVMVKHL
jgi:hypothetical protein